MTPIITQIQLKRAECALAVLGELRGDFTRHIPGLRDNWRRNS